MVQDVNIVESELDWATEKTLNSLLTAFNKAYKLDKAQGEKLEKAVKSGAQNGFFSEKTKKSLKDFKQGLDLSTKEAFKSAAAGKGLGKSFDNLKESVREASMAMKATSVITFAVSTVLGRVYARFTEFIGIYKDMSEVGLSMEVNVMSLSRSLAAMGMNMDDFSKILLDNTRVMALKGADAFTRMVEAVEKNTNGFTRFGLTMAEGASYSAEFLEQQRLLGQFQVFQQQGFSSAIQANIERLTAYSKILNVSRQELMKGMTEAASDLDVRTRFAAMGYGQSQTDAYLAVAAGAEATLGPEFRQIFTDIMAKTSADQAESFKEILRGGGGPVAAVMRDIKSLIEAGDRAGALQLLQTIPQELEALKGTIFRIAESEGTGAAGARVLAGGMLNARELAARGTRGDVLTVLDATIQRLAQEAAEFETNMARLREGIDNLLLTGVMKLIEKLTGKKGEESVVAALDMLNDAMAGVSQWLLDWADGKFTLEEGFGKAIDFVVDKVLPKLKDIIVTPMVAAVDRLVNAIKNFSFKDFMFGNDEEEERLRRANKIGEGIDYWNMKLSDASRKRDSARQMLQTYADQGVYASFNTSDTANAQTQQVWADQIAGPLIEAIRAQTEEEKKARRELERLRKEAELNSG